MKFFILLLFIILSNNSYAFPTPKDGKASFDIIRKNKIIGNHDITFIKNDNQLLVQTNINIKVKFLFIPAYKFSHTSSETWINNEFIEFKGHTDFEDEREYYIKGRDEGGKFIAEGMDGKIQMDINIIPSNLWNIDILSKKEVFDIQKGIKREISVKNLGKEKININNNEIITNKFSLNASTNPKDKTPFPEYTLWYSEKNELIKFKFINYKDKKDVIGIRNDLIKN